MRNLTKTSNAHYLRTGMALSSVSTLKTFLSQLMFWLLLMFAVNNINAQSHYIKYNDGSRPVLTHKNGIPHPGHTANAGSRSANEQIILDYDAYDNYYAQNISGGVYSSYSWNVNSRQTYDDDFSLDWFAVVFDSLVQLDGNNNVLTYPKSAVSFVLDSFQLAYNHQNHSGTNDTLTVTVMDRDSLVFQNMGTTNGTLTGMVLWDTVIIANTSLSDSINNFDIMSFYPGLPFANGKTFAIRVDFSGDTIDKFAVSGGSRDDCNQACLAEPNPLGNNSYYFLNWTAGVNNQFNNSGLYANSIFFDCDTDGVYTPGHCENMYLQNIVVIPFLTANVQYGVGIHNTSPTVACPGLKVNLDAYSFGSNAAPFTYAWSASAGTLTNSTGQTTSLILSSSLPTVSVTVTDANNVTASASLTLYGSNRGINISVTNVTPIVINCGSSVAITTAISGTTTGKNYHWSNGVNGPTASLLTVNSAGTYIVSVSNSSGCTATDTAVVTYTNGVTNTASFTLPTLACATIPVTFINTSAKVQGWNATWEYGDNNIGFTVNGFNTYASPGLFTITLTEDSAGCTFVSLSKTLQVVSPNSFACTNHNLTVDINSWPTVCPGSHLVFNPTVTNGVEPYSFHWTSSGDTLSCINCRYPSFTVTQNSTYTVTVYDANNASATAQGQTNLSTGGAQNNIQFTATNTTIDCSTPTATTVLTITGGVLPYVVNWGNGTSSGTSPQSNLYTQAGVYVITVMDTNYCFTEQLDTVPYQGVIISVTDQVHPTCEWMNTGKIKISASGGTPAYSYFWSNGATTDSIIGLVPRTYHVTVTDNASCSASLSVNLNPQDQWGYHVSLATTDANCSNNGRVDASLYGGIPPYSFLWSTAAVTPNITGLGQGSYLVTVTDSLGCAVTGNTYVQQSCVSVISGIAFIDSNANCISDGGDQPAQGIYVVATGNGQSYYGFTDADGHYTLSVPNPGTFHLQADYYNYTCGNFSLCNNPTQYITIVNAGDSSSHNNFAFAGSTPGFDLMFFPRWSSANPGFVKTYQVYPFNYSNLPFTGNGYFTLAYDTNLIYQNSSPLAVFDPTAHTLTWQLDTSLPAYWFVGSPYLANFLTPVNLSLSYNLQTDFYISPTLGDCDSMNNHLHTSEPVTGSFDPNEKEVEPAGKILETDSILTYTIHFQNTGTDSTHFIIVKDTLPDGLNPATVRTVASSHPYTEFSIKGKGILTWVFDPLRLVDSATDEAGSKGFVKFQVKKRANLPLGTSIANRASIYFDYNVPVLTNTATDTVYAPNHVWDLNSSDGISIKAFPNPFNQSTNIVVDGLNDKFDFELYDLTGRLRKHLTNIQTHQFELLRDDLSTGIYFYRLATSNGKGAYGKLMVE